MSRDHPDPSAAPASTNLHVLVGHCGFITARAGIAYDIRDQVAGLTTARSVPPREVADAACLAGGFFEVFVPPIEVPSYRTTAEGFTVDYPPSLDRAYALVHTVTGVSALLRLERDPGARVRLVRSVPDICAARRDHDFAAILHLADADAIDPELDLLHVLHAAGLRSWSIWRISMNAGSGMWRVIRQHRSS